MAWLPLLRLAAAGVVALPLAAVALGSAARTLAEGNDFILARAPVVHDWSRLLIGGAPKLNQDRGSSGQLQRLLKSAIQENPLAAEPYLLLANLRAQQGSTELEAALMEAAIRRDPRNAKARAWMLTRHLGEANVGGAIGELDRLLVLAPDLRAPLLETLALLSLHPDAFGPVASLLGRKPAWRPNYLEALTKQPVSSELLVAYLRASPEPQNWEQQLVLEALLSRGEGLLAGRVWSEGTVGRPSQSDGLVYDSDFKGLPGARPFNWAVVESSTAGGEFKSNGLELTFAASTGVTLVEQTLLLSPGQYRLSSTLSNDGDTGNGRVFWRLSCRRDNRDIVRLSMGGAEPSVKFVVPSDCPTQRLSFVNEPSEFSNPVFVRAERVDVVPIP